jgi:hypothetical protein
MHLQDSPTLTNCGMLETYVWAGTKPPLLCLHPFSILHSIFVLLHSFYSSSISTMRLQDSPTLVDYGMLETYDKLGWVMFESLVVPQDRWGQTKCLKSGITLCDLLNVLA